MNVLGYVQTHHGPAGYSAPLFLGVQNKTLLLRTISSSHHYRERPLFSVQQGEAGPSSVQSVLHFTSYLHRNLSPFVSLAALQHLSPNFTVTTVKAADEESGCALLLSLSQM